jgi:hypothetical protein
MLSQCRIVRVKDQKDIIQSELRNGKKTMYRVLNFSPKYRVPTTSKMLKVKFQHNPMMLPNVKRQSFRFIVPRN